MIDFIVGAAIVLSGVYVYAWARNPALRDRVERPKHVFLQQVQDFDRNSRRPE
jgi:hypothetical protein